MKLNLSEPLGVTGTFTSQNQAEAPSCIQQFLCIQGVQSVYTATCFLTLNRDPRVDWSSIVDAVQHVFAEAYSVAAQHHLVEKQGQIRVEVQTFRQIPIQVKATDGVTEKRVGLSARFGHAARELQIHFGSDYLKERYWADWGVHYGDPSEVAQEVTEEIESLIDEAELERRLTMAKHPESLPLQTPVKTKDASELHDTDWYKRFQAVQQLEASEESLPFLIQALHDEKPQIRRWVAAKLAGVKTLQSVKALSEALLNDSNIGVRRTAGDSLSDIGDVSAQEAVCKALSDNNKLVRWRAARFLSEVGTDAALPSLEQAKSDPEYEVRMEVEAAIKRIRENAETTLPVWKLMSKETP